MKIFLLSIIAMIMTLPVCAQEKFKGVRSSVDEFNGTVTYEHYYVVDMPVNLKLYIIVPKDKEPQLYLRLNYRGSDWVFFTKVFLQYEAITDSPITIDLKFNEDDKKEEITSSPCLEYVDIRVDEELLAHLDTLVTLKRALLRFEGKSYKNSRVYKQVLGFADHVLAAYYTLMEQYESKQ